MAVERDMAGTEHRGDDEQSALRVNRENASRAGLSRTAPPIDAFAADSQARRGRNGLAAESGAADLALRAAKLDARAAGGGGRDTPETGAKTAIFQKTQLGGAVFARSDAMDDEPSEAGGWKDATGHADAADLAERATECAGGANGRRSAVFRQSFGQRLRDAMARPVSEELAADAAKLVEPGTRRDRDAQDTARAYTSPDRARRALGRSASRRLARHDKAWRKHATKAEAHRAKGHKLRSLRSQRKARKAARKADRWMAVRHRTTIRGSLGLVLKIAVPMTLATLLILAMLVGLAMCSAGTRRGTWSDLSASENAVALYLLAHGLDETHAAAIMGNMRWESGGSVGNEFNVGSVEDGGSGAGHGLCQWSFGRWSQLQAYADSMHRPWADVNVQLDYFWTEYCNDPVAMPYASYQWSTDVYTGETYNHLDFEAEAELHECVRRFRAHFERANVALAHDDKRIAHAERYYAILTSSPDSIGGLGQDYASATADQRTVVNAAYSTPFVGDGLCATWVTYAFGNAGLPAPGGNACDMARAWWCSSTDRDDLKVGMVIAVERSPYGLGQIYGHVGIYIGDGKVMHNSSALAGNAPNGCQISGLDEWIAEYEYGCKARWGWALDIDLAKG